MSLADVGFSVDEAAIATLCSLLRVEHLADVHRGAVRHYPTARTYRNVSRRPISLYSSVTRKALNV